LRKLSDAHRAILESPTDIHLFSPSNAVVDPVESLWSAGFFLWRAGYNSPFSGDKTEIYAATLVDKTFQILTE
jgi:hypothetical protein